MKKNRIASILSFGLGLAVLADVSLSAAQSETVTTSKTTTYTGVVSDINPSASTIILKSETSPAPVTYTYTKETTFVDANGNVVTSEAIRNSPVRVEYVTEGGVTIVRRVIQTQPAVVMPAPAAPTVVVPAPAAPTVVVPQPPAVIREKTTTHTETNR